MFLAPPLWTACSPKEAEAPWRPDVACPGDPTCPDNEGTLRAGAAAVSITPTCFEDWIDANGDAEYHTGDGDTFRDCGCDHLCPEDPGWPGPDEGEGDGVFQAVWMAGFQTGRPAQEVHDDLWVRVVVLDQGSTRLALAAVDLVGWMNDDVLATREALALRPDLDVDHLVVTSTHVHEGPDTMGIWGKDIINSGYDADYAASIREATVQAIEEAVADLREVGEMRVAMVDAREAFPTGIANLIRDSRNPTVIDPYVRAIHLADPDGATIATLVNWGNHPETLSDENNALTSDFSHYIRTAVEEGTEWDSGGTPGLGGVAVYLQGTVGGLMTPLGVDVEDPDGVVHGASTFDKAEAIGSLVGELALQGLATSTPVEEPRLAFSSLEVRLPIDNIAFQAMFLTGVLGHRSTWDWNPDEPISEDNQPRVRSEVGWIGLGPVDMLAIPGELFPEVAWGGYDGSLVGSDLYTFIDPDNPNPPDIDAAPEGPYWADLLEGSATWVLGLANDEVGYLVPAYDFELAPEAPYIDEAEGDHYEETNSLGPDTVPLLDEAVQQLLGWSP